MGKMFLAVFLCVSLAFTSVMAGECCHEHSVRHHQVAPEDQGQPDHKGAADHHCACQHVMAEPQAPTAHSYLRLSSRTEIMPLPLVLYRSLSYDPLLKPPLQA